jgi:hypothetical protein
MNTPAIHEGWSVTEPTPNYPVFKTVCGKRYAPMARIALFLFQEGSPPLRAQGYAPFPGIRENRNSKREIHNFQSISDRLIFTIPITDYRGAESWSAGRSKTRREYVLVGSTAASLPPTALER